MHRKTTAGTTALQVAGPQPASPTHGPTAHGLTTRGPVAFTIALRLKPGREAEFLDLLHPLLDAMRTEPTFVNALLHRDPDDPTRFLIYETWTELDDVRNVQLHPPYRRTYLERLPGLLAAEREIGIWEPLRTDRAPRPSG